MKKTLLTISAMVAGILSITAQCTAVQSCTPGSAGYCATPASGSTLTTAYASINYNQVIQVTLGTGGGAITGATVTSVTGLPTGITAVFTPSTGSLAPGGSGCVQLSGLTSSPAGMYTMTATFVVGTVVGNTVVPASWYIPVSVSSGIESFSNSYNTLLNLFPNPAKSELTISSDSHMSSVVVLDALGKVVLSQELNYTNQAILDVRKLEKGLYFIQVYDRNKTMTKKFIKD